MRHASAILRATAIVFTAAFFLYAVKVSYGNQASGTFDLDAWRQANSKPYDLKSWRKENPSPYRSWFGNGEDKVAEKWYVSLGPLGLITHMHDRSWGMFDGFQKRFPQALCEKEQLIFNAYEVLKIKPGSPCAGKLKTGDLILAINGQWLEAAQNMYVGEKMDHRQRRGLDIHAGLLLDKAEGTGKAKLTVLRLPNNFKPQDKIKRSWQTLSFESVQDIYQSDLPKAADLIMIKTGRGTRIDDIYLRDKSKPARRHDLASSAKRGAATCGYEIPEGDWQLVIKASGKGDRKISLNGTCTFQPSLPDSLTQHLKNIDIDLPAIGAFGDTYNSAGKKAANIASMLAHRLVTQQSRHGAMSASGYGHDSFPTAIVGLALLAHADPAHEQAIQKAAHYVAEHIYSDKWSYIHGTRLLFLAEYYLRTKDQLILPALRTAVLTSHRYILGDYTSGHSYMKPGYGGSGYIGGGGMIALGLAAASHTPAMTARDLETLDRMITRIQELAPGGRVPYGRGGKITSSDTEYGQHGSCGTGPYFLAALIRGGAPVFTQNAMIRYSSPPYGSADGGHATQTLHLTWSLISSARGGKVAFQKAMRAYTWFITLCRDIDGTANKNNYRIEYHNGDGVIGEPYWRTAGLLLALNAHKKNLALSGHPAFQAKSVHSKQTTIATYHQDLAIKQYMLRNWQLVKASLNQSTPEFDLAYKTMHALTPDRTLAREMKRFFELRGRDAVKSILNKRESSVPAGLLAELMMGISFTASFSPKLAPTDGKKVKRKQQAVLKNTYTLSIAPHGLRALSKSLAETAALPLKQLRIVISDPSKTLLKSPIELSEKKTSIEVYVPGRAPAPHTFPLSVSVQYVADQHNISYQTEWRVPTHESRNYLPQLTSIPIKSELLQTYSNQYALHLKLPDGKILSCEHYEPLQAFIPHSAKGVFHVSPGTLWAHEVRKVSLNNPAAGVIPYKMNGGESKLPLTDLNVETAWQTTPESLNIRLDATATIKGLGAMYIDFKGSWRQKQFYKLEAQTEDGHWVKICASTQRGLIRFPATKATQLRLSFTDIRKNSPPLAELHFLSR